MSRVDFKKQVEKNDFSSSIIDGFEFGDCNCKENLFCRITACYTIVEDSIYINCDFEKAKLKKCKFRESELVDCSFNDAELIDTIFMECTLKNIDFTSVKYENVTFTDCQFENVTFTEQQKRDFGIE